jgi:DNA 3'-phosphatase
MWQEKHTVLFRENDRYDWKENAVCFSLDQVLVKTRSDKSIPRNDKDWEFKYANTVDRLQKCKKTGYSIIILTNDKSIGMGKISKSVYCQRIDNILEVLSGVGVEPLVIIGTKNNSFSKPYTRLWKVLVSMYKREGKKINAASSIYVGEMGGRLASKVGSVWGQQSKDPSYEDRAFSKNIGLRYFSSHEFFNQNLYDFKLNPESYPLTPAPKKVAVVTATDSDNDNDNDSDDGVKKKGKKGKKPIEDIQLDTITGKEETLMPRRRYTFGDALMSDELKELELVYKDEAVPISEINDKLLLFKSPYILVIFIGPPGSGKSTLARHVLEMINKRSRALGRDDCCFIINKGTVKGTVAEMKRHIKGGADIIIDRCCPSTADRMMYLNLIHNHDYGVLIIKMEISDRLSKHLTCVRIETSSQLDIEPVPASAYIKYNKKFQDPSETEYSGEIAMIRYTPILNTSEPAFWFLY